jgi:hypothetical protein
VISQTTKRQSEYRRHGRSQTLNGFAVAANNSASRSDCGTQQSVFNELRIDRLVESGFVVFHVNALHFNGDGVVVNRQPVLKQRDALTFRL